MAVDGGEKLPKREKGNDDALVLGLARGLGVRPAAAQAGLSERTAFRRKRSPEFCARVRERRSALVEEAAGLLAAALPEAVKTLRGLLEAKDEGVRLRAARGVLELALHFRESGELAARIEELEQDMMERKEREEREHERQPFGGIAGLG